MINLIDLVDIYRIQKGASQMVLLVKNLPANAGDMGDGGFYPWVWKIPWRRAW